MSGKAIQVSEHWVSGMSVCLFIGLVWESIYVFTVFRRHW